MPNGSSWRKCLLDGLHYDPGPLDLRAEALGREQRAGCPERFYSHTPPKPHCYDADIQREALAWFDRRLGDKRSTGECWG